MTLVHQIKEAQQALTDLLADEAELSKLEQGQAAELQTLKDQGSKDFAQLVILEGKRAALASMLTEQRSHIAQARAGLASLEAEQGRTAVLAELRARVSALQARRSETDGLLSELGQVVTTHLAKLTASRVAWLADLEEAQEYAVQALGLHPVAGITPYSGTASNNDRHQAWHTLFEELGTGARDALTQSPVAGYTPGLNVAYDLPGIDHVAVGAARTPFIRFFDRPVAITLARAVKEADQAAPHSFAGGE
ncbi:hypothetical protein ACFFLM_06025 [Deinococcus oregonensis]|uniref:Uncharacterized protein n=1 Tax=Deinococcus oregonensis TaxID=1805970 RepID=A0ABV6AVJ9_9DEIO